MFLRYAGPWEDVAVARHMVSAHRLDSDDLTFANVLDDSRSPALRPGEVEITEQEFTAGLDEIAAYNAALPAPAPPPPLPDPNGFKLAAYAYLTVPVAVTQPLLGYVTIAVDALNSGNWAVARQIIAAAAAAGALTAEQYTVITGLLDEYAIPVA